MQELKKTMLSPREEGIQSADHRDGNFCILEVCFVAAFRES